MHLTVLPSSPSTYIQQLFIKPLLYARSFAGGLRYISLAEIRPQFQDLQSSWEDRHIVRMHHKWGFSRVPWENKGDRRYPLWGRNVQLCEYSQSSESSTHLTVWAVRLRKWNTGDKDWLFTTCSHHFPDTFSAVSFSALFSMETDPYRRSPCSLRIRPIGAFGRILEGRKMEKEDASLCPSWLLLTLRFISISTPLQAASFYWTPTQFQDPSSHW